MEPPRRVRLKPWLVAQVSSRRFPGLRWLDPEHRRFVIPWGHATRNPPGPQDHDTIFKAWAQETGRFRAGDPPDPPRWKATLRCALNKSREFRLLVDGPRGSPAQPFRVYELCEEPPGGAAPLNLADGGDEDDYGCSGEEDVSQLHKMTSLSIHDTQHGGDLLPPYPWAKEEAPPFAGHCPPGGPFGPPPPALLQGEAGGTHGGPELLPGALAEMGPPLGPPGPSSTCPVAPTEHLIPDLLVSPHTLPLTDLELKFQYRGRQVCALTVSNPHGCRLFHSSLEPTREQEELFGPLTLEQVPFPAPDAIPNEKQRFYTHQLLDVLDRGLILELQGQDLFALRLCQCKVFWTGPCAAPQPGPNPIQRERRTKLFSLEGFLNGLIQFQKGQTPTPPPFEIFLCFGEEWPDQKPKEKKLITVQVRGRAGGSGGVPAAVTPCAPAGGAGGGAAAAGDVLRGALLVGRQHPAADLAPRPQGQDGGAVQGAAPAVAEPPAAAAGAAPARPLRGALGAARAPAPLTGSGDSRGTASRGESRCGHLGWWAGPPSTVLIPVPVPPELPVTSTRALCRGRAL
ncbi:interferon regulatory factor 5 isoform X2 [Pyrgilauda ruficollis]|uniref:interferon regulatory factor 5 isoform X2 n=1 Tax=Pyrgilauda ruficollis TaxID=221976 RepID=UPI001B8779DB|nr:interferon regulatory factor 5 isoform X2 [Pyrgilauda ruficollis]